MAAWHGEMDFSGEGNKDKSSGETQQCSRCMDLKKKDEPLLTPRQTKQCWLVWFKPDKQISQ